MVVHQKDAALPVDAAIGAVDQVVGSMVRIGGAQPLQDRVADVGHIIAIGVLQKPQIRAGRHEHAVVPKLKAEGVVHVCEDLANVGLAVVVGVFKDHQAVVHLFARFPLGIGVPAGSPQPTLGIHLHLHGVGQIRKVDL